MMDAVLVENFHAAHRQRRSGMLRVEGAGITQQFAFHLGDPVAIDFGVDKEQLLVDALLRYHRIAPEFHQAAIAVYRAGHATISETVLRHQAASEEELARTTQAMVEDALCRVFSEHNRGVFFDDGVGPDVLDFQNRAFRLRIDAELLLRTTGQRIDELRALAAADPSWSMVYALAEAAPVSDLGPFDKLVLNFVDGQRTVGELAVACRDSSPSLARTLSILAGKGFVRRVENRSSTAVAALAHSSSDPQDAYPDRMRHADPAPLPSPTPSVRASGANAEFIPVRRREEERSPFPLRTVMMAGALAVAVGVGWLVLDYESRRRAFQATSDRIVELLVKADWQAALAMVGEAGAQAGNDLEAKREVDALRAMVNRALGAERDAISALVETADFAAARSRMRSYPSGAEADALRARIAEAERSFEVRSRALAAEVEEMLRRGDVLSAVSACSADGQGRVAHEREAAREVLDRWRAARLDEAVVGGSPVRARRYALDRLRASAPSQSQMETADRITRSIEQQVRSLGESIQRLSERFAQGQVDEVASEMERLRLVEQAAGSELDGPLGELRQGVERRRTAIADFRRLALSVLRDPALSSRLPALAEQGDALAQRFPGGSAASQLTALAGLLRSAAAVPDDLAPEARAERTLALSAGRDLPAEAVAALGERADLLRRIESLAAEELLHARRVRRDGDLERTRSLLEALVGRPDLRRSEARKQAESELIEVEAAIQRRAALKVDLERAIASGDVAAAGAISREMGLPYLPLVVDSVPRGAVVTRNGTEIGRTPLILDVPAAERVDADFGLAVPGYRSQHVRGAQAEGGWRLLARLERQALATARIPQVVTSRPLPIAGKVVVAGRLGLAQITASGGVTHLPFQEMAVDDPIYGPAASDEASVLVPTRNRLVLQVSAAGVQRLPLAAATDDGIAVYRSDLVVGRRLLVVAGADGRLYVGDGASSLTLWKGSAGAEFVTGPLVIGERVLSVRRDGYLEMRGVEEGQVIESRQVGAQVLAAWTVPGGFAGITTSDAWKWTGGEVVLSPLPFPVSAGGERVAISPSGRVAVQSGEAWNEVGRLEGQATALPIAWRGHAVIPQGRAMTVLGERGFTVRGEAELLPGAILGDRLVVIDQAGQVSIFAP